MENSRPGSTGNVSGLLGDRSGIRDTSIDVEQLFQALFLHQSLVGDEECSEASSTGLDDILTSRAVTPAATLREMRRTGPLGEMSEEGYTRLLAGTLYEYNTSVPPTPGFFIDSGLPATPVATPGGMDMTGTWRSIEINETIDLLETAVGEAASVPSPIARSVSGASARSGPDAQIVSFAEDLASEMSPVGSRIDLPSASAGDTQLQSPLSTARSDGFWRTARTVMGATTAALNDSTPMDGEVDVSISAHVRGMLQQLAEDGELDDTLAGSARRMVQLGSVANGQRLSDEEMEALPKIRFESVEQQSCAICLEAYSQGELLTALRCNHFFHTECLTRWFQRSTQCPLCRSQQCGE
mmetsp:Transcript_106634/g.200923  ORF Transcript_106634/g.200923 Transcript_106634/m.200923 type:complete len:355 (-) Transcript_106634:43-1107(-)